MDGQPPKLKVYQASLNPSSRKRSSPSIFGQPRVKAPRRRARTKQDFLDFCLTVLNYANYHPDDSSEQKEDVEPDYNLNSRTSPVNDSLGETNSDSGASNGSGGANGYDGSSTATAVSSPSACTSEEEDEITCFCGKPFANRPMICCNDCETWIHMSCAKVRQTNIPEIYVCSKCREASQSSRRSSRPRMENKKFTDDH